LVPLKKKRGRGRAMLLASPASTRWDGRWSCLSGARGHKVELGGPGRRDHWCGTSTCRPPRAQWPVPSPCDSEGHAVLCCTPAGSTGKPKGNRCTPPGGVLGFSHDHDGPDGVQPGAGDDNQLFWCTADIGWVTGHSYVIYGDSCRIGCRRSCTRERAELFRGRTGSWDIIQAAQDHPALHRAPRPIRGGS